MPIMPRMISSLRFPRPGTFGQSYADRKQSSSRNKVHFRGDFCTRWQISIRRSRETALLESFDLVDYSNSTARLNAAGE